MNFKIIEKLVVGKDLDQQKCEDKLVVLENFVCIIDGATSKSKMIYNNTKSGLIASEIIKNELNNIPKDIKLEDLVKLLTMAIRNYYKQNNLIDYMLDNPVDRLSAALVIYSNYYNEVWMIGDCQCMIGKTIYTNQKIVDEIISNTRAFFIESEIAHGKTVDEIIQNDSGREFILPLLERQSYFQNTTKESIYNYSVIDGFNVNYKDIKIINVNNKSIILASDGYPKLFDSLSESEMFLEYVLNNDPLCFRLYKTTKGLTKDSKSYDDRAYIRFEIP